jgi:2-oxoglutarate ferredoxin oxidoreductase subunit beta
VTSTYGSLENPVNPLLYVLAYGAPFVAQGTPADIPGLTSMVEEAIRYPGFAFVNVQSPCVTYGEEDQQIKAHKATMKKLRELGHDPSSRLQALDRAQSYGTELVTGIYYQDPNPPPTLGALVRERQEAMQAKALPRERILEAFLQR